MSSILSVIIGLIIKDVLDWASTNLSSWIAALKKAQEQHTTDQNQSNQDVNPVETLPAAPTAAQETAAGNDALSHL